MTENEKLFLNENARIYHVGRPAPVRKKRSRSIVFCAAAAVVLALWEAPDNGHFTDMVRTAAQASAGVELMCFDGIFSGNSTGASPADNANIANEAEKMSIIYLRRYCPQMRTIYLCFPRAADVCPLPPMRKVWWRIFSPSLRTAELLCRMRLPPTAAKAAG